MEDWDNFELKIFTEFQFTSILDPAQKIWYSMKGEIFIGVYTYLEKKELKTSNLEKLYMAAPFLIGKLDAINKKITGVFWNLRGVEGIFIARRENNQPENSVTFKLFSREVQENNFRINNGHIGQKYESDGFYAELVIIGNFIWWLKVLDAYKTLWDDLISNHDIIEFPKDSFEELMNKKSTSVLDLVFESVENWKDTPLRVNLLEVFMDWKTGHYSKDWSETKDLAKWKFKLTKTEQGNESTSDLHLIFRHRPI